MLSSKSDSPRDIPSENASASTGQSTYVMDCNRGGGFSSLSNSVPYSSRSSYSGMTPSSRSSSWRTTSSSRSASSRSSATRRKFKDLKLENSLGMFDKICRTKFFHRAFKVFLMSYAGYDTISPNLYQQKFKEYLNSMQNLYAIREQIDVNSILNDIAKDQVEISIRVKNMREAQVVSNLRAVISVEALDTQELLLNPADTKNQTCYMKTMKFDEYLQHRLNNSKIKIRLISDKKITDLQEFTIGFQEIQAEGFEDWFDFGKKALDLLIKIDIRISNEKSVQSTKIWYQTVPMFHLHTIYFMLMRRYAERSRAEVSKHSSNANKSKVSYIRRKVSANSQQAFWSTHISRDDILNRIRTRIERSDSNPYSEMKSMLGRVVKFIDIQIPFHFFDEFEDSVCLCNEWCNWNAFFHHNPIYRFLIVQHSQLYLTNKTTTPDMYLLASAALIEKLKLPEVPILQLIGHANQYRKNNYIRYYLPESKWKELYHDRLAYADLNGNTYKILRFCETIPEMILQLNPKPFSDICLESFVNFERVFLDLHSFMSTIEHFVDCDMSSEWDEESEAVSRQNYKFYMELGCARFADSETSPGYDYLFTEDIEYSNAFARNQSETEIKEIRDRVTKFSNPSNVRFILGPFTVFYTSIYKFIIKITQILPKPQGNAISDTFDCYNLLDIDLTFFLDKERQKCNKLDFFVDDKLRENNTQALSSHKCYTVFYTLKLYSIGFGIQRESIKSLIDFNEAYLTGFSVQVCKTFKFWDYTIFEEQLRSKYKTSLFSFDDHMTNNLRKMITDLYSRSFTMAQHEESQNIDTACNDLEFCVDSGFHQYKLLYFWWKNTNDRHPLQISISSRIVLSFKTIEKQSKKVFHEYIIPRINDISQTFAEHLEVMDVLVYYLTKANCVLILSLTSRILTPLHDLQNADLCKLKCNYTLAKPGWVKMFKTMDNIFARLHRLKTLYMVFDDQNNRISNAIRQTISLIKDIYRQFYAKLCYEWFDEIEELYWVYDPIPNAVMFLPLHLAVGLSFISNFIDTFRIYSRTLLKKVDKLVIIESPYEDVAHQMSLNACGKLYKQFMKDGPDVTAQPFFRPIWKNTFQWLFDEWEQSVA